MPRTKRSTEIVTDLDILRAKTSPEVEYLRKEYEAFKSSQNSQKIQLRLELWTTIGSAIIASNRGAAVGPALAAQINEVCEAMVAHIGI